MYVSANTNISVFCCSEYIKIFDGNGTEVFALHGLVSSFPERFFPNISFGEYKNVTIQVSLASRWSNVNIDFGTSNQVLDSGNEDKETNSIVMDAGHASFEGIKQLIVVFYIEINKPTTYRYDLIIDIIRWIDQLSCVKGSRVGVTAEAFEL